MAECQVDMQVVFVTDLAVMKEEVVVNMMVLMQHMERDLSGQKRPKLHIVLGMVHWKSARLTVACCHSAHKNRTGRDYFANIENR